jgi:hypothetical protein
MVDDGKTHPRLVFASEEGGVGCLTSEEWECPPPARICKRGGWGGRWPAFHGCWVS